MPRPRLRREPCDCRDCVDVPDAQPLSGRKHAAALLDPPPKCVVVYGDAFLALSSGAAADAVDRGEEVSQRGTAGRQAPQDSLQAAACPHLHRLARDGCSGFVALPTPTGVPLHGVEALQLLFGVEAAPAHTVRTLGSIADRFKQLHAELLSNNDAAVAAGRDIGFLRAADLNYACAGLQPQSMTGEQQQHALRLPPPASLAALVATTLDLVAQRSLPATLADSYREQHDEDVDMLVIHVDRAACARADTSAEGHCSQTRAEAAALDSTQSASDGEPASEQSEAFEQACAAVEWLDTVVQHLNIIPGFRDKVLLLVALGWRSARSPPLLQTGGELLCSDGHCMEPAGDNLAGNAGLMDCSTDSVFASVQRPAQSFEAVARLEGNEPGCAEHLHLNLVMSPASTLLVVRRLPAVVRVDCCGQLGVAECLRNGGDGPIAAQHLLPELAFKLGRAPKYGA